MKITKINTRFLLSLTATALFAGNAAFAQLGQSDWQTPGGASNNSSNSAPSQGLGQSDWQTPSGNSGGGGLGQSGWQQPPGQQQQQQLQQFQTAPQQQEQQQQPQQLGQSNWQQPASNNQLGQSNWQQPPATNQLGQSDWQQPTPPAPKPLQGSASKTTTLGDALNSGQSNSASSDIDPAAAAMMMSQLNGGANGAGMNMGAAGGAMNPAAMMMGGGMGGGMGGVDPMAAMSQMAPALGALMMVMPNNNGMNMGMPSSRPFTGGFAVPRRAGTVYNNNNSGGIGNTVNKVLPPSMVQGMMRQMMYQGMSRAMYH